MFTRSIMFTLFVLIFSPSLMATLFFDVSVIYKKGIDQDLVLTNELQSRIEAKQKVPTTLPMKNGLTLHCQGGFKAHTKEYGPSEMVAIDLDILRADEIVKEFKGETKISWPLNFSYHDNILKQLVEITVTPRIE